METFEKIEALRAKANVSFEEAKNAMEACNYDMLEAMAYPERQGKVNSGSTASYTTTSHAETSREFEEAQKNYEDSCQRTTFGALVGKFFNWCGQIIKKSVEIDFCVTKQDRLILKVPVLALVLALLLAFWLLAILLIVGLFCSFKYSFVGVDATTIDLNQICDKASETCENIKRDFQNNK